MGTMRCDSRCGSARNTTPATATRGLATSRCLPLGVLELLAGAGLPVLLALPHARIARKQSGLLERQPQLVVEARERAREAVADGAGLAGGAAALDGNDHV